MSSLTQRLMRAVTRNDAATSSSAEDPRLRGRTYAIPFEDVWRNLTAAADGGLRGWRLVSANDQRGRIRAKATVHFGRAIAKVDIDVGLDEDGQTRVDARAVVPDRRADFGACARRLHGLFTALDAALERERAARSKPDPRDPTPAG